MAMATILNTARDDTLVVISATKAVPTLRGSSERIKPGCMRYRDVFKVRTNPKLHRVVAISFAAIFGLTTLLAGGSVAKAQEPKWATSAGGANFEFGYAIAADPVGNSYVTGLFTGPATFGAGEANETVLEEEFGVFVAKYARDGTLLWATSASGASSDDQGVMDIATDLRGNSYVTGYFVFTATFGAGEANETVLEAGSSPQLFVAKYARDGTFLWVRTASGSRVQAFGSGIVTDPRGNSYVTGFIFGTATFGAGEANETTLEGEGGVFVAKYARDGTLLWVTSAGDSSDDWGRDIATDLFGNSYVTGHFFGTATFGAGERNETVLEAGTALEVFVAKYARDGTLLWARSAGGADNDWSYGVATDLRGNGYVTGHFAGTSTFGAGEPNETELSSAGGTDVFVAKYNR
jgi:Beta-propeller repeat